MHLKSGPSGRHIRRRTHKGAQKRENVQAEIHDRKVNILPPEKDGSGRIAKKNFPLLMFQDVNFPRKTENWNWKWPAEATGQVSLKTERKTSLQKSARVKQLVTWERWKKKNSKDWKLAMDAECILRLSSVPSCLTPAQNRELKLKLKVASRRDT